MGTEVGSVFGGDVSVVDRDKFAARAKESTSAVPSSLPEGTLYMNFSGKKGTWTLGTKDGKRTIGEDERWVVNINTFQDGWQAWNNKKSKKYMWNVFTGTPVPMPSDDDFGPFNKEKGDGWNVARGLTMKSVDNDVQGYCVVSSKSAVRVFSELLDEITERSTVGDARWPVCCLTSEEFESQGETNDKPVFNVIKWLSDEEISSCDSADKLADLIDGGEEAEEKPKTGRRRRS